VTENTLKLIRTTATVSWAVNWHFNWEQLETKRQRVDKIQILVILKNEHIEKQLRC